MYIFDGIKFAASRETLLKDRISSYFSTKNDGEDQRVDPSKPLKISAILFKEDTGSQIYTRLKSEAAQRVGINYEVHEFSLANFKFDGQNFSNSNLDEKINELNNDSSVTGIILQKPWRRTWIKSLVANFTQEIKSKTDEEIKSLYNLWWSSLTSKISEKKDVDGLHPNTIEQIKAGTWQENGKVLPATCRAVLTILDRAGELKNSENEHKGLIETQIGSQTSKADKTTADKTTDEKTTADKTIILGKSDLLGIPLFYELLRQGKNVELIASKELESRMESGQKLFDASTIVSATGIKNLITGEMVSDGVTIIDVGEPAPDVDLASVSTKTSFITPVPGGVGPMTVISLLENCVSLVIQGEEGELRSKRG